MREMIKYATVAIHQNDQTQNIVGTGFMVGTKELFTCAHVVNAALGFNEDQFYQPTESVFVSFPLISTLEDQLYEAKVVVWNPIRSNELSDAAGLVLINPPQEIEFLVLLAAQSLSGHPFETFGFGSELGIWVEGVIRDTVKGGQIQVDAVNDFNAFIQPGFSGAPLWDKKMRGVVGMIVQVYNRINTAYIIPVHHLEELWADIKEQAEPRYLRNLMSNLRPLDGVQEYVELEMVANDPNRKSIFEPNFHIVGSPKLRELNETTTHHISDLLEEFPRMVIIGEPGAGKTTSLRRILYNLAEARLHDRANHPIPFFLELPRWTEEYETPEAFIRANWDLPDDPITLLFQGELVLLLDGLNEMGDRGSRNAQRLKKWLAPPQSESQSYPQRVIITCRKDDYDGQLVLGLPVAEALKMDVDQIEQFAYNYLGEDAYDFLDNIPNSTGDEISALYRLAQNPFTLRALIEIFQGSPTGDLPSNTGKLFQQLIHRLWQREENRSQGWVNHSEMENIFSRVAFNIIERGKGVEVPLSSVSASMNEGFLRTAQSANIIEVQDGNGSFRFYHQLMLEYFAAVYLKKWGYKEYIQEPQYSVYKENGRKPGKWDQVFIALTGISQDSERTVINLAEKDPSLATYCVLNGVQISNKTQNIVFAQLTKQIMPQNLFQKTIRLVFSTDETKARAKAAAYSLAQFGHVSVPYLQKIFLNTEIEKTVRQSALSALEIILDYYGDLVWKPIDITEEELEEYLVKIAGDANIANTLLTIGEHSNEDVEIREKAIDCIAKTGDHRVITNLLDMLEDEQQPEVVRTSCAFVAAQLDRLQSAPNLRRVMLDERGNLVELVEQCARSLLSIDSATPDLLTILHDSDLSTFERAGAAIALGFMHENRDEIATNLVQVIQDVSSSRQSYIKSFRYYFQSTKQLTGVAALYVGLTVFSGGFASIFFGGVGVSMFSYLWITIPDLRRKCVEALGRLEGEVAKNGLIEALEDESWNVRIGAKKELRQYPFNQDDDVHDALAAWKERRIGRFDAINQFLPDQINLRELMKNIID